MKNKQKTSGKRARGAMTLRARVLILVAVVVAGLAVLVVNSSLQLYHSKVEALTQQLRSHVQAAVAVADGYQKQVAGGSLKASEARSQALAQIKQLSWNKGANHIFAFDDGYTLLFDPALPASQVGQSVRDAKDQDGKLVFQAMHKADAAHGHAVTHYVGADQAGKHVARIGYTQLYKPWNVHFGSDANVSQINAAFDSDLVGDLIVSLVVAVVMIVLVCLIMRSIRRSVGGEPVLSARLVNGMADGELELQGARDFKLPPGSMMHAMQRLHRKLLEVLGSAQRDAAQLSDAACAMASGHDDLTQRAQEQAASLTQTASSMEEMTATVKQNADNASRASELAAGAQEQAKHGGQIVSDAVAAMRDIDASSKKIADIVGMIDEIAFQTNLLALNASVEAARAGEHGRGFAVVANEVRGLSQRSADAAREIKTLIGESVARVESGSKLVQQSGGVLDEIVASVDRVSQIVSEIAGASKEQSIGIDQVNQAVVQMDEVTQRNATLVEEATAAAQRIQARAAALQGEINYFHLGAAAGSTPRPANTNVAVRRIQPPGGRRPAASKHSSDRKATANV